MSCTIRNKCYTIWQLHKDSGRRVDESSLFFVGVGNTAGVYHYAVESTAVNKERKYSVSKREEYEQKTEELLEPIVTALGFELVDVEYVKEGGTWYLRAYIDKPGGITVDDCEGGSAGSSPTFWMRRIISRILMCLRVSSPGLGRPLKKEKDFKRSLGEEVEIRTYRAIERQKEFTGILKAYDENTVTIAYEDDNGTDIREGGHCPDPSGFGFFNIRRKEKMNTELMEALTINTRSSVHQQRRNDGCHREFTDQRLQESFRHSREYQGHHGQGNMRLCSVRREESR